MGALEDRMIDYAASLDVRALPAEIVHHAKRRVIDTFGAALAAYSAPPVQIARKLALPVAGPFGARVWGSLVKTTPDLAAFANGVMLRYLDINDTHRTLDGAHPSDNLSGILAVAEAIGASGLDLIQALVISYEIQCRFVDSVPFNDAGWDQPVPGVMACALAIARLLGLSRAEMQNALALAIIPNLCTYQTRAGELSMWKGCATAASARAGLFAALLALEGMTGPTAAFEGRHGVWEQVTGPFRLAPLGGGGRPFAIERSNLKFFPAEYHSQAPIWLALELRHKLAGAKIAAIDVQTYHTAWSEIGSEPEKWQPKTRETADHSLPYLLAAALTDGAISVETFSERRINDPALRELMGRIKIAENPEFTRRFPGEMVTEIALTTAAGERHVERASYPKGHVRNPMTDADVESKFCELSNGLLRPDLARRVLGVFRDLENVEDFGAALDTIRVG